MAVIVPTSFTRVDTTMAWYRAMATDILLPR
jgi:hypothetical protein